MKSIIIGGDDGDVTRSFSMLHLHFTGGYRLHNTGPLPGQGGYRWQASRLGCENENT